MKLILAIFGKPYALIGHVRFDKGGNLEIGYPLLYVLA